MSILVLFGAGASFGSDTAKTPPLGSGLFDALVRFNPDGWGQVDSRLAEEFRRDFELAIQQVNPTALAPLQRAMAAYFFEFVPRTTNLYIELGNRLAAASSWRGVLCTLNYERLLDISLSHAGVRPIVGSPTQKPNEVEVCFPHGCSHIFCDGVQASGGVSFSLGVQTDGAIRIISDHVEHRRRILSDAFPPVMSYFEPQKRTTSGRSFIEAQRSRMSSAASDAEKIIIVGVRVREHDTHIWNAIAESPATVVYCSGEAAGEEFSAWSSQKRKGKTDYVVEGYFADAFESLCEEMRL